jgi:lysyl-tRNA synthetase class 2
METPGGGTDVHHPAAPRRHFVEPRQRQESGAEENPHENDDDFVRALESGMLTASGCGLGVDRLMMILTDSETLRDVILFPSMREKPAER